jgi:hypothetical protein
VAASNPGGAYGSGGRSALFLQLSVYIYDFIIVSCVSPCAAVLYESTEGSEKPVRLKRRPSLSKNPKDVMDRAEASFKKEERAREGAKAMREYEAEGRAVREKTARLKLLRLAKEAAEKTAEPKKASRQSKITP